MLYLLVAFRNKLLNLRNKSNIALHDVVAENAWLSGFLRHRLVFGLSADNLGIYRSGKRNKNLLHLSYIEDSFLWNPLQTLISIFNNSVHVE